MPKRIQRKRTKGWRMPTNTVSVTRPGQWGNPFVVSDSCDRTCAVQLFREYCKQPEQAIFVRQVKTKLHGKNLACFCPLNEPCHADVLLEIAHA